MRPAGRPPASESVFRARCDLFRDLVCAGMTRNLIGRAIALRTEPAPEDGPDVAAKKLDLASRIGAPLTERQIDATYDRVAKEILDAFERDRPFARAVQAARLQQDMLSIRSDIERTKGARDRLYLAAHRHEELYSKVAGTQTPQEVRIDASIETRRTLLAVVMAMSPDEQEQAIAEQEEHERLESARGA